MARSIAPRRGRNDPEQVFAENSTPQGDCIIWTGSVVDQGYGEMYFDGRKVRAHRYAWERVNGLIPDGLVIDHKCFNRACVKVDHLRAVTRQQNSQNRQGALGRNEVGIRGVGWVPRAGKFRARVRHNDIDYHLGYYDEAEEAGRVAAAKRRELGFLE